METWLFRWGLEFISQSEYRLGFSLWNAVWIQISIYTWVSIRVVKSLFQQHILSIYIVISSSHHHRDTAGRQSSTTVGVWVTRKLRYTDSRCRCRYPLCNARRLAFQTYLLRLSANIYAECLGQKWQKWTRPKQKLTTTGARINGPSYRHDNSTNASRCGARALCFWTDFNAVVRDCIGRQEN